jgi:periplasmic protein TonB
VEAVVPLSPPPLPPPASHARPTWEGRLLGALNRVKRYPLDAQFARRQGTPYVRFVIDRRGRVLSARVEQSSGVSSLDREALALSRRAQPLPEPPPEVLGDTIEPVVPIEFHLDDR